MNSIQEGNHTDRTTSDKCHKESEAKRICSRIRCSFNTLRCMSIALLFITIFQLTIASVSHLPKHLVGVHPERISHYNLESSLSFKCLDGSGSIPLDFVNDDYCDCRDASDEPGTAACPHGRFFCPNEGYIQRLIPSSWVNDNQCDCCDASDEYNSTVKCENTCSDLGELYRKEQEKNREIADQGAAIRSQYKEQARLRKEQNSQLLEQYKRELSDKENAIKKLEEEMNCDFGPAQVFFPLKGQCFNFKDREYTYTLCPFERATQESTSGMQTELGRWSGWAGPSDDLYSRQKYEGGIQCWNGPARSALVKVSCGVEDKVISVTEPSKCEYVYDFITPAACPDLDPPEPTNPENPDVAPTNPSALEVEETLEPESNNYFNDEQNEAPDGVEQHPDEKHDEL